MRLLIDAIRISSSGTIPVRPRSGSASIRIIITNIPLSRIRDDRIGNIPFIAMVCTEKVS